MTGFLKRLAFIPLMALWFASVVPFAALLVLLPFPYWLVTGSGELAGDMFDFYYGIPDGIFDWAQR